jgi:hypothetical protein
MKNSILLKITIITLLLFNTGCVTCPRQAKADKDKICDIEKPITWVHSGTLVNISPDKESTQYPEQLRTSLLGETKFNRTHVETTQGTYTISDKVPVVEIGTNVDIGYVTSDSDQEKPLYLALEGVGYVIVR